MNPKKETEWKIKKEDGQVVSDELEVAELFNDFFINKIDKLKKSIDPNLIEDPLVRLKEKMKNKTTTLDFKPVTKKNWQNT